jgi:non-ribosomal peptide synthase protein (TIGR01720 family)
MLPSYLVCLESLPRTASGKVDRRALPQPSADSPRAELDHPRTPVEALLADLWQEALGRPVGIHENFFQLGGDSILSLGIVSKAARAGFALRPGSFFSHPTIAELASVVETSEQKPAADAVRDALWPAPLTPIQSWFFEQDFAWPQHWNQAVFLELGEAPGVRLLEQALDLLMRHHEALRLRFRQEGGRWLQQPEAVGSAPPLLVVDLAALEGDHRRLSEVAVCNRTQRSLEIGRGPVFRVVLFQGSPARLLLVAHHLVVDGVSWRILLEDLASLLGQLAAGAEPSLPAATASLGQWTRGLEALLEAGKLDDDLAYWQKACRRKVESLLPDDPAGDATGASAVTLSRRLDEITTSSLLGPALKPYRSRVDELLLTALALAVRAQEGSSGLLVEVEGHGREDLVAGLDLSRTVGWLTSRFPLLVELTGSAAFGSEGGEEAGETPLSAFMIAVKEGLRRVPQRGASFGVLRYLAAQEATGVALRQGQPPTLTFNYLGQAAGSLDGWPARFLPWQAGAECGPENRLPAEIEVLAMVVDGSLELRWTFSRQRFDVGRMERLIGAFATAIGQVVSHCLGLEQPVPTPSDYPLAGISLSRLRALSESFGSPEDLYPVSPVQAGMLFHTLHRPGEGQYIEQLICDLLGPLNLETFRQAWAQVLSHHSVLRTAFLWRDLESPLQAVAQAVSLPLQLLDWSALDEAEASAEERALLRRDRARGFDLAAPPLLRLTLIRRGQERHRLLWTVHHLLLDGGSEPVVLREVFTLYRARLAGRAVELAVRRPFRDYIAWLEDQDREADRSFWREALQGFAEPNRLPSGEGEGDGGFEHREEQLFLSATVTAGLLTSCRQAGLTPSIPIQAAWALVLADLCQQEDVVFGLTLSGRPPQLAGAEEMVGMFLNTLPCRVRLSRGEDLVSWLGRLHQSTAELLRHGSSSLAEIQAANGVTPGAGLFETIVVFMNQPRGLDLAALAAAGGLKVDRVEGVEQTNYPLTLTAFAEQRLLLQINYRVGRFSDSFCRSLLRALEGILSRWSESFAGTVGEARSALEQETRRRAQEQTQQVRQLRQRVLGRLRPRGAASGRVPLVMPASSMEEIL